MKGTWQSDNHGSGVLLLVVVVVAVIAAAAAAPIVHAAEDLLRILLIGLAVIVGLGIAGAVVALVLELRGRRRPPPWAVQVQPPQRGPQRAAQSSTAAQSALPPQIHLHVHGPVSAADVAELIARQGNPQPAIEKEQQ